ncbi:acetyltransferase [Mangrovibacter sp. MFB070]|uniref:GNAT family N-acetyltransferase n=1 Tax=Mangrovibacter sp. MFB070 TaxID=1224318 RepID=UPI0004DA361D|nr:GNAT family N-acetyltransferase [Mangrovibacter sp. MFB070]KEA50161.1 acetyltransferase [Mangrovibacter sp. MFB070]
MIILTDKNDAKINWQEVADLIESGGLNKRNPSEVQQAFMHSTFTWFGFEADKLVATARAISDLTWASYLADVVVSPGFQGTGLGKQLMLTIKETLFPYGKTFIYAVPDKIPFYEKHGFCVLLTGMVCDKSENLFSLRKNGYIR